MSAPEKKQPTNFRIPETTRRQLKVLAAKRDMAMGDLLAQIVAAEFRRDQEQENKAAK